MASHRERPHRRRNRAAAAMAAIFKLTFSSGY
jgi:hypothetical protein